jgi:hypothetical protein
LEIEVGFGYSISDILQGGLRNQDREFDQEKSVLPNDHGGWDYLTNFKNSVAFTG